MTFNSTAFNVTEIYKVRLLALLQDEIAESGIPHPADDFLISMLRDDTTRQALADWILNPDLFPSGDNILILLGNIISHVPEPWLFNLLAKCLQDKRDIIRDFALQYIDSLISAMPAFVPVLDMYLTSNETRQDFLQQAQQIRQRK